MKISQYGLLALCMIIALCSVGLEAQKVARMEILPSSAIIKAGHSVRFTVIVHTPHGSIFTPTGVRWVATGGSVGRKGRFTANNMPGNHRITAHYGAYRASAMIHVKTFAPAINRIVIQPTHMQLRIGQPYQFKAFAYDRYNRPVAFTPLWQVTGGGTITQTGYFRPTAYGQYKVVVSPRRYPNSIRATAVVTVRQPAPPMPIISRLQITPHSARVYPNQKVRFTVVAYNQYGRIVPCVPTWGSNAGRINQKGVLRVGYNQGRFQVWASVGSRRAVAKVMVGGTVPPPPPPTPHPHPHPGAARIVVTGFKFGGNFFKPKVQMYATAYGRGATTLRLYAVKNSGHFNELQSFNVTNGKKVYFNAKADRFATKYFELRLYNRMNRIIARWKTSAK